MSSGRGRTVGIDFGTSTTLIAERSGEGLPVVLPIGEATSWMPSLLAVDDTGELVAGEAASRLGPSRVVSSIKSALTAGEDEINTPLGTIDVREGVATLLREAMSRAEAVDSDVFKDAEIFMGCPALWTGHERKLLVEVAHDVGLDVDIGQIIDEPVAAGLHWVNSQWLSEGTRPTGKTVVFDAGGGTLDIAYLDVAGTDQPAMTVLSAEGRQESGDALDDSIVDYLGRELQSELSDELFGVLLRNASRTIKESLSFESDASVPVGAPFDSVVSLSRTQLEEVFASQLKRADGLVQSAVRGGLLRVQQPESPVDIRKQPWSTIANEVRHVALVGGLSNVPIVSQTVSLLFPGAVTTLVDRPQESVVRGLVYGDSLDELNLPRPPVDFCVEYPGLTGRIDAEWMAENRLVYEAFSPLYSIEQLQRGESLLGYEGTIPVPPNARGGFDFVIACVMPNRARTRLSMAFRDPGSKTSTTGSGITLRHDGTSRAILKLYTNGEFIVRSGNQSVKGRIAKWPRLRGPNHDFVREIELETGAGVSRQYRHPQDDWRWK